MSNLKKLSSIDPLALAEELSGESDPTHLALALSISKSQAMARAAFLEGDFLFSDTLERREALLEMKGWVKAGIIPITQHPLNKGARHYKESLGGALHVWTHSDGFIFVQDTHTVRPVNSGEPVVYMGHGKVYFCWKGDTCPVNYSGGWVSSSTNWRGALESRPADLYLVADVYTCDGLFWVADKLRKEGTLFPVWPADAFRHRCFMFLHSEEIHLESLDYSPEGREKHYEDMRARVCKLGGEVQRIANVY